MTRVALVLFLGLSVPANAQQAIPDQMLCEPIMPCTIEVSCHVDLPNSVSSLERVGGTWLWDPLAQWAGFPVGLVETLPQARVLAQDEATEIGLVLVPAGRTETGAIILDGYGFQYFPRRDLNTRAMRHHCTPVSETTS